MAVRKLVADGRWNPMIYRLQARNPRHCNLKNQFMAFSLINAVLHVVFGEVNISDDFFILSVLADEDVASAENKETHDLKIPMKMNIFWPLYSERPDGKETP